MPNDRKLSTLDNLYSRISKVVLAKDRLKQEIQVLQRVWLLHLPVGLLAILLNKVYLRGLDETLNLRSVTIYLIFKLSEFYRINKC
jgi:hypothetical protein